MFSAFDCPSCGAPLDSRSTQCPYCGRPLAATPTRPAASTTPQPAWTQGISQDGFADGSFDVREYPELHLSQAIWIIEHLPIPPRVPDPGNYCPPALGFGERNISRNQDGSYFLWPEDRSCPLDEARQIVQQIYQYNLHG